MRLRSSRTRSSGEAVALSGGLGRVTWPEESNR